MSESNLDLYFQKFPTYKAAEKILRKLEKEGFETWFAGGCVRDSILGIDINDFDLATSALPDQIISVFGEDSCLIHGAQFGSIGVKFEGNVFEITTFRSDIGLKDHRRPQEVKFSNKEEDIMRRDFTINGLFYHPERGIFDIVNGVDDIKKKTLKAIGDPDLRFEEDALRILRLYRFSLNLGFSIEPETLKSSVGKAGLLKKISKERIFDEILKTSKKNIDQNKLDMILKEFNFENSKGFHFNFKIENKVDELGFKLSYVNEFLLSFEINSFILKKPLKKRFLLFSSMHRSIQNNNLDLAVEDYIKNSDFKFETINRDQKLWLLFRKCYLKNVEIEKISNHLNNLSKQDFDRLQKLRSEAIKSEKNKGSLIKKSILKIYKKEIFGM